MTIDPYDNSAVSPGWSDNVPLAELNSALAASPSATAANTQANSDQRFWSTPARPASSPVKEVMEVTLSTTRLVNTVKFQAATYPHSIFVEYYDEQLESWTGAIASGTGRAEPISETILESVPGVIPPANAVTGHLHPQHSFSGHWTTFDLRIRPTYARRIRLVLTRITQGAPPRNTLGQLIDYSLAINNLELGYQVSSPADVPRTNPITGSYTEREAFASTSDILGSAVNYSVRVNSASNILQNGNGTSATKLVWRSEPQPFPWAVVNFYVDARDQNGQPQVIDRFYLEPLTDGANINLYYSNDEPTTDFVAGDDPLPPNVGVISGTSGQTNVLGRDTYSEINFVDVDNTVVGFNPGRAWWMGFDLLFNFTWSLDNANHALLDCPEFSIAMTPLGLRVSTAGQDVLLLATQDFNSTMPVQVLVWYDGAGVLRVATLVNGEVLTERLELSVPFADATIDSMRFGGFQGPDPGSGAFRLNSYVLKIHEVLDGATAGDYLANPAAYAIKPVLVGDDDHRTDNAILRFDPGSSTPDFPSGFLGGPPDHYAEMQWSPIARDYVLHKGFLYLPPTQAKYWKLEFCNLVPQPYEVYVPVKRTVRTYSREMWSRQPGLSATLYSSLSFSFPGLSASISLSSTIRYQSQSKVTLLPRNADPSSKIYSNTMVRIVNDISIQSKLGGAFWAWNFVSWHANCWCPRFERVCVHEYQVLQIEQKTKIAYFAGLQKVEAYRLNYLAVDDTAQYVELFHDLNNIEDDSNWHLLDTHQLTSGDSRFAQIDSKIVPTNKMIRAVQFAAVQSPPKQVLPDHDFDDTAHQYWESVGDGHIVGTQKIDVLGSVLRIDRAPHPLSWGSLEDDPGEWGAFEGRAITFRIVEQLGNPSGEQGGIQSALYDTPPGGRVHAAARVVTPKDLAYPLFVQIVDESDRVMAESGTSVQAGQVAEWFTSYTIGEGGRILAYRWADFAAPPTLTRFVDSFDHADAPVLQLMDSGQAWTPTVSGTTTISHSIVGNEALQNALGTAVDAFTTDTVWGGLEFQLGTMGNGSGGAVTYKIRDLTGPGQTDRYGVGGTDLGITAKAPDGRLVSIFGDTFEGAGVGGAGWRSPVALFAASTGWEDGIDWTGAAGPSVGDYADQIIGYAHNGTLNGFTTSTVIPNDLITIGSTMYLHVAGMNPYPTVAWTGLYQSTDNGETWTLVAGSVLPGTNRGGFFQLTTMCDGGDGYIYVMATGQQRNKGLILLRAPIATFTNMATWQDWAFISNAWQWTSSVPASPSVILTGSYGELCLRRIQNQMMLVCFDAGNYRIDLRQIAGPTANLYTAPLTTVITGVAWGSEDHTTGKVAQLYGGFIVPGSTLDNLHLIVSQWNTGTGWPYRSMQFRTSLTGSATTGAATVPLVGLDPFYLTTAGALLYRGGIAGTLPSNVFGRALQLGDTVHIDVMPTKQVPTGRRDTSTALDDVSSPWSFVFFLNGVWTSTFSHRLGMRYRKYIQGTGNQRFRSISWTPSDYSQPVGPTIWRLPVASYGGSYDGVGATWTDPSGNAWARIGAWENSGSRLVALSTYAQFRVETGNWFGTLHARVHNIAKGNAANPLAHGNLLVLDADNAVFVDAYGYVMQNGAAQTRLFPTGIPADSNMSVQFADTKQVAQTVRGAIDPLATPRMLIGRLNGVIVGTWASTQLNEWNGTVRGLSGDPYNNGVDSDGNPVELPAGANAGDMCTSFDMFAWAPDVSTVSLAPDAPTWDDVTKRGTVNYAQASQDQLLEPNRFRARLVQKGETNDMWEIDTLSMFTEPIVWYFSNDGGQNFFPAYDIRNNPHGVLTFPAADPTQPYNPNYGQQLVWRAVSYSPEQTISSLVIRPWYAGLVSGVTHRIGVFAGDPNVMPYDHYPSLESDARFQTWNLPIPQEWWYASRILESSKDAPVEQPQILMLPEAFLSDLGDT